ncbi:MAG: hypothetical protein SWO11_21880 [Thermodesulfobacteriota bacterium]|nr:hypothetical protein [Thermodesulfobacteriota bacterium]
MSITLFSIFTERIAQDKVSVLFPAPYDEDPAFWMPDNQTISSYQRTDFIMLNGAHYAKWREKIALPLSKIVNTSHKFRSDWFKLEDNVTHTHGNEGEHTHAGVAFT